MTVVLVETEAYLGVLDRAAHLRKDAAWVAAALADPATLLVPLFGRSLGSLRLRSEPDSLAPLFGDGASVLIRHGREVLATVLGN